MLLCTKLQLLITAALSANADLSALPTRSFEGLFELMTESQPKDGLFAVIISSLLKETTWGNEIALYEILSPARNAVIQPGFLKRSPL